MQIPVYRHKGRRLWSERLFGALPDKLKECASLGTKSLDHTQYPLLCRDCISSSGDRGNGAAEIM